MFTLTGTVVNDEGSHYTNSSTVTVSVVAFDDGSQANGGVASATVTISVGGPPVSSITAPAEGTMYRGGATIQFEGIINAV